MMFRRQNRMENNDAERLRCMKLWWLEMVSGNCPCKIYENWAGLILNILICKQLVSCVGSEFLRECLGRMWRALWNHFVLELASLLDLLRWNGVAKIFGRPLFVEQENWHDVCYQYVRCFFYECNSGIGHFKPSRSLQADRWFLNDFVSFLDCRNMHGSHGR